VIDHFVRALTQWPLFLDGFFNTVWLCVLTAIVSLFLAMLLVVPLMSRLLPVRATARLVVDSVRSVPFLLLAYMAYYCLPAIGISLSSWAAALITLIVYNTAYFAEILRGAWSHLPPQQEEGGRAFGFTGIKHHLERRAAFVVSSPDPPKLQEAFARARGWNFRMVSASGSGFFRDMGFEDRAGNPMPGVSVFTREPDGSISRLQRAEFGPGDAFCPVWHFFDLLADGVNGWEPR